MSADINWDPCPSNMKSFLSKSCHSSSSLSKVSSLNKTENQNMDELFVKIKEYSDIYRRKRQNSSESPINWSFKEMDISVSSEDSDNNSTSVENPILSPMTSYIASTDNDEYTSVDNEEDNEESEQQMETNVENETNSSSEPKTNEIRRSKRKRIPVMEKWRGQRPIYKRDSTGITQTIVGIEEGIDYTTTTFSTKKSKKRKKRTESHSNKDIFNLSIHTKNKRKFKSNKENSLNIPSLNDLKWNQCNKPGVDIGIVKKDKEKSEAIGWLRFQGEAEKALSKTGDYRTYLTIVLGVLSLTIDGNEAIVRSGHSFEVQSNTSYSLVNLRKDIAYVQFYVFK